VKKNGPKLCVLPPYSRSVVPNGPVYEFLRVLRKNKFSLQIHVLAYAYGFTENSQFAAKIGQNLVFLGRDPHIPDR
jgi:hypothetical protein